MDILPTHRPMLDQVVRLHGGHPYPIPVRSVSKAERWSTIVLVRFSVAVVAYFSLRIAL